MTFPQAAPSGTLTGTRSRAVSTSESGAPPGVPRSSLSRESVGWVAAHGGAGTTTLAIVLGGTDLGCRWPDPARNEPGRVLLVARTHAAGLRAAARALNALREGRHPAGMELVSLVLVADSPGRLPLALARRIRVLRSVTPVRRIPWIAAWRLGKQAKVLPKAMVQLGSLVAGHAGGNR
jgi:hypothetical protein